MEATMVCKAVCPVCGKISLVQVDTDAYRAWLNGEGKIQNLLPSLTPSQREILMTGTCDTCWDIMWGGEEE
jgi:hypothetical protein